MSKVWDKQIGGQHYQKFVIQPSKFVVENKSVRFIFPDGYDSSQELIIDPVIIFSTVVGSTADNWGFTATYDVLGNLYAAGIAFGSGYPTTIGSFAGGSFDISVTKWDSTGSSILYSTYIGGFVDDEMTPEMERIISENKVPHIHFRASVNLSFDIVIFVTVLCFCMICSRFCS